MSLGDFLITGAMVAAICLVVASGWWGANQLEMWVSGFVHGKKPRPLKGVCCECGGYSEECVIDDIRKHPQLFCPQCILKPTVRE